MNLSLIRSMTRSAVFELENGKCFRPEHPFAVALNGKTIYESCNTNVFSLFSLTPSTTYTVEVDTEGEHLKLDFTTEAESFFVDASRYGLVADVVIEFIRPEQCKEKRTVKEMQVKKFGKEQFSGLEEFTDEEVRG